MERAAQAGANTEYGRALCQLMHVQADEAQVRKTHSDVFIHECTWAPGWRASSGARGFLERWVRTAPARIAGIVERAGSTSRPALVGYSVQSEEMRPLLTRLAAVDGGLSLPSAPARPSDRGPTAAPSLAAAKLIEARAEVARVRTELKRDRRWVKREDLEFRLNDAATRARQRCGRPSGPADGPVRRRTCRYRRDHARGAERCSRGACLSRERAPAPIARPASSVDES